MSKLKIFGLSLLLLAMTSNGFCQNTIQVKWYFKTNFIFGSGFWVYQDTATGVLDSITLISTQHGYYGPNPAQPNYTEYYKLNYYSHANKEFYNDFFWDMLWRRNGGGEWAQLGQPIMDIGQFAQYPEVGNGFNGYEILGIMDSLVVESQVFYNIVWSHIYKNQQYQQEFDYNTDLFFSEDVGIVKKVYTDENGFRQVWNLKNWEIGQYVVLDDFPEKSAEFTIHPNPATFYINIVPNSNYDLRLMTCQGKILLEETGSTLLLNDLPDGMYLLRIIAEGESIPVIKKIHKIEGH